MKAEGIENKNSLLAICRSSEAAGGARSNCYEFFCSFCRYKKNEEKLLSPAANDNPELSQHYFNANHLGSGSLITDDVGATYQTLAYAPHGELLVNEINGTYDEPYKFTGYERDQESGLDYAHARYREPNKTIFYSTDPMWFKYPHITPYAYCANNPVAYIDPDGKLVSIIFDREKRQLRIIDLDHYNPLLFTVAVSAKDYIQGGVRDKDGNLLYNQELVIDNTFSGGQVENGTIVRDRNKSEQQPISNATFDIVDNNADTDTKHKGWFRLDRQDSSPYNDRDDVTGRRGFRFHLGGLSHGCVTVDKTKNDSQANWDVVSEILNNTSTTTVKDKRGNQWLNPSSKLTKYGTMHVIGADKIPYKPQEE